MSVIVKGIEMPKDCDNCDFMEVIGKYGNCFCNIAYQYIQCASLKPDWCPLVEIKSHGRLIDADECYKYFYDHLDDSHMEMAQIAIDEMPTIIEAEDET